MKKRILVVEDDQALARVLSDNLTYCGFDVSTVGDGNEVVGRVRSFCPDLVLLDIMLPGQNGFDLCGVIRQGGRTPVIMLTARDQKPDKVKGLELGADDYVTKPFDFEELQARIRAVLRRARLMVVRLRLGKVLVDFNELRAVAGRREIAPDPAGVRPAVVSRRAPEFGGLPHGAPPRGLGLSGRAENTCGRLCDSAPSPEDRNRSAHAALYPHRARRRLLPHRDGHRAVARCHNLQLFVRTGSAILPAHRIAERDTGAVLQEGAFMSRHVVKAGLFVVFLAVAVHPAIAQRTTGEIIGKTIDESGAVMPGVTITLRGAAIQGAQTDVTSATGSYRFAVLPPGTYDLEYVLTGFGTVRREGIPVAVGSTVELNITLKLASLEESVTITGQSPVVDITTSQVSTSYNKDWVENAPVRRFSYFDLINSAPGVSQTTAVGTGTTATALGSSTNENQYQIDGTVIGSDPWLSTDAVEEIEVLTLGASAEYGNVQGAVFNVVTRQGGNSLHGSANYYFQNDALTSSNTDPSFDKGYPYHRDTWRDFSVQASGPFIQDKFWFFGLYEYQRDYDSQPGVNPAFPAKSDAHRMFWKFTYSINEKHRLLMGYHDDFYFLPAVTSPFDAPSSLSQGHGHNPTPNIVYTSVLSSRTFMEGRFSGKFLQSSTDPQVEGEPRVGIRYQDQDTSYITGAITQWTENRTWQYGFSGKVSHVADEFLGGSHDLQAGLQFTTIGNSTLTGPNDVIRTFSVTNRQSTGTTQLPVLPRDEVGDLGYLRRRHLSRRQRRAQPGRAHGLQQGLLPGVSACSVSAACRPGRCRLRTTTCTTG